MDARHITDLPVVGVDLDETSFDLIGPFFEWHNGKYGTKLSRANVMKYELLGLMGCSADELQGRFEEFNAANLILLQPMPGAREALRRLARAYRLVAFSSRPLNAEALTRQSLEQTFPGIFSGLYLTGQSFDMRVRYNRTKGTLCRDFGAYCMIEDSLEHAREIRATSPGTRVLLYDHNGMHPWNQLKSGETMPEGVIRCHTWEEVPGLLGVSL